MKKLFFTLALAVVGLAVNAQDAGFKGKWYVTSQVGYSQQKGSAADLIGGARGGNLGLALGSAEVKSTSWNVLPIVGTFISPTVTVGLAGGYISAEADGPVVTGVDADGNDVYGKGKLSETKLWVIQPLIRKYWVIGGGLTFFGQAAVPVIFGTHELKDLGVEADVNQFGLGLSAGFDMIIWNNVSLEFSYNIASFSVTRIKPDSGLPKETRTNFSLAHVANVSGEANGLIGGPNGALTTPVSVGIKFFLN